MSAQAAIQPVKAPVSVKPQTADEVFDRIERTYNTIAQRAFEIFNNNGRWFGHEMEDWVRAEVPGFTSKELTIDVEPQRLTITGKHEAQDESKQGKTVYSERCAKEVMRVVELPSEVDTSKVNATLKDGILNVEMPKAAHAKTVRVEAKTA